MDRGKVGHHPRRGEPLVIIYPNGTSEDALLFLGDEICQEDEGGGVRSRPPELVAYSVVTQDVGDRFDASVRVAYRVWMDDGTRGDADGPSPTIELVDCALAGTTLRIEGQDMPRPRHMDGARWSRFAEWSFEAVTGVRPSDLDAWNRPDPDVTAAERSAGWDPNP